MARGHTSKKPRIVKFTAPIAREAVEYKQHHVYHTHEHGAVSVHTAFIATHSPESNVTEATTPNTSHDIWQQSDQIDEGTEPMEIDGDTNHYGRKPSANPLLQWLPERTTFLDEFIRLEGHCGDNREACDCGGSSPLYRCIDCFGTHFTCVACILVRHVTCPLHIIEEWNGDYFRRVTLKSLGLRIQLGHAPGTVCYRPKPAPRNDFVVIDTNGIHEVNLDFCGCEQAQTHYKQLLRSQLFPATTTEPRTAATFRVLKSFHLLSLESKVSAFEFYSSLGRLTDNTGLRDIRDRYPAFLRMSREFRHLKQLKRAGRGHDPKGVDATQEGECAVKCPACPHPGINLPSGWEKLAPAQGWIYALFIAIDANFRLKRKSVSSDQTDPSLNCGWAYFVKEESYKAYLGDRAHVAQEKSTCVGHNAVNMADSKSSRGLAATGVGTVDCARHDMKLPNGVGDLQKGERYINMDYLVFSAVAHFALVMFNFSYDIACQWHKKLWSRMSAMPEHLHLNHDCKIVRFFVPKFHLKAHVQSCQTAFSFNFTRWVGRTDGEAPERGWAIFNRVASSTKEMGPGSRRDHLDDQFGDSNWKKRTGFGKSMLRKLTEALRNMEVHRRELEELGSTIEPMQLEQWLNEVQQWEEDPTKPNPFVNRVTPLTQSAIRLRLAEKEAQDLQEKTDASLHTDISPLILISSGMDIQDIQRRLASDSAGLGIHATDLQKSYITARRNALQRKLDAWMEVQLLYMPSVATLRAAGNSTDADAESNEPEKAKLWLPSELSLGTPCNEHLQLIEWELRYAQAEDALNEVRRSIQLHAHLTIFKTTNIRGQRANTRARGALDLTEKKKRESKVKYTAARHALLVLGASLNKVGWEDKLRPLCDSDMRHMTDMLDGQTEGTRDLSWIWKAPGVLGKSDDDLRDCLRIEWCKARARDARWAEEVVLLREEMRRILVFLEWEGNWWMQRASARTFEKDADCEGSSAYAKRQAALWVAMAAAFKSTWGSILTSTSEHGDTT